MDAGERLSLMCDLGRLAGRAQVFVGARGFGKTSLLREIQRRAQTRGAVTAWVTAGEDEGLIPALGAAVRDATRDWRDAARLLPALEQMTVSVNLGVASAEAQLRPSHGSADRAGARAVEATVRAVVKNRDRADRKALVLFVDEIQAADHAGLRTLAYAWQHLQAEGADVPAGIFAAGLPDSPQAIVEAVSSSERFAYLDLGPLGASAVVEALAGAARALGVEWQPGALEATVTITGGYPFTVQLIGDYAWKAAGYPDQGGVITEAHAVGACEQAQQEMARLIEGRYSRATPAEQQFMSAMAKVGDGPVRRADIVGVLGVSSSHVSNQRDSLLKDGLIRSAAYGSVEFTIPGMAAYLRQRSDRGPRVRGWEFTRSGSDVISRARPDRNTAERTDRPSPGPARDVDRGIGDG